MYFFDPPNKGKWKVFLLFIMVLSAGCGTPSTDSALTNDPIWKKSILRIPVGSSTIELVKISPGEFDLGAPVSDSLAMENEGPQKHSKIETPYFIGRFEITQEQYELITGKNPSVRKGKTFPVEGLTFSDALLFCDTLSRLTGMKVSLPTEIQWEYACRAGGTYRFQNGDTEEDLKGVAWFRNNSDDRTHNVGEKSPNHWGIYDMLGNVWEPCADFLPNYDQWNNPNDIKTNYSMRAMRGGGWAFDSQYCRASTRMVVNSRFGDMGVRIVINP